MKQLITLLFTFLFLSTATNAQIFWNENFESGSSAGLTVDAYTGPNGPWTLTVNGDLSYSPEATSPNYWYVSCAEAGHIAGACGSVCGSGDLGASLHVGSNPTGFGDIGAAYDAGGVCGMMIYTYSYPYYTYGACVTTNRRAESPTINCTGKTSILLRFYYIENGETTNDDGSVWYSPDNGVTWSMLQNTPKTTVCGSGQGQWAMDTITLPASANNNPNVKIGFSWVNNDDGLGTDPSYAIDSITLSTPLTPPAASMTTSSLNACQDSCITYTSTSIGTIDSIRWVMPGVTISTPHANPLILCNYPAGGSYTMHLYVYGPGGVDSDSKSVTINALPLVTIIHPGGDLLSAGAGFSQYIWSKGIPPVVISGATSSTYTISSSGIYGVAVDSAGCWGYDTISVFALGVNQVNKTDNKFWLTPAGSNAVTLHTTLQLKDDISVNIFDAAGKQILEDTWSSGTDAKQINDISVPPGSYLIKLNNRSTSEVLKWTKQ